MREVADVRTNVNQHWQRLSLDRLDQWFPNNWLPQFSGQNCRADVTILVGIACEHSESFATVSKGIDFEGRIGPVWLRHHDETTPPESLALGCSPVLDMTPRSKI
jgi:hypothetical protein